METPKQLKLKKLQIFSKKSFKKNLKKRLNIPSILVLEILIQLI